MPEGRLDSPSRAFVTQFFMIGICGGYTTFSSFSLQTLNLLRDGEWLYAGGNVVFSVVLCLARRLARLSARRNVQLNERKLICKFHHDAMLLRIFIGESDRWEHKPLYEAIVLKAREMHLAGATVLRGPMGFGKASRLHTAKILRLSMDLPLVIEIVDSEEKINSFLPVLDEMMGGGLVTLEKVKVIDYRAGKETPTA